MNAQIEMVQSALNDKTVSIPTEKADKLEALVNLYARVMNGGFGQWVDISRAGEDEDYVFDVIDELEGVVDEQVLTRVREMIEAAIDAYDEICNVESDRYISEYDAEMDCQPFEAELDRLDDQFYSDEGQRDLGLIAQAYLYQK